MPCAILTCLLLLLTACSQAKPPTDSPWQHEKISLAPQPPQVRNPLDPALLVNDPCRGLSPAQLLGLRIESPGRRHDTESLVSCVWVMYAAGTPAVTVYYVPGRQTGLSELYLLNSSGEYGHGYFEPTTIVGYPAVLNSSTDDRSAGICHLSVGLNDQFAFSVHTTNVTGGDPCQVADTVAAQVILTIQHSGR